MIAAFNRGQKGSFLLIYKVSSFKSKSVPFKTESVFFYKIADATPDQHFKEFRDKMHLLQTKSRVSKV